MPPGPQGPSGQLLLAPLPTPSSALSQLFPTAGLECVLWAPQCSSHSGPQPG